MSWFVSGLLSIFMSSRVSRFVSGAVSANVYSTVGHDGPRSPTSYSDSPRPLINYSHARISMALRDSHETRAGEIS
jgi:hypothetical protein